MEIHLTPAAAEEIRRMQRSRQQPDSCFRLAVKTGGCAEFYYTLALSDVPESEDIQAESEGISILVDGRSAAYLQNIQIDYAEDLMGGGFRFDNYQATETCSCGLSFRASLNG